MVIDGALNSHDPACPPPEHKSMLETIRDEDGRTLTER